MRGGARGPIFCVKLDLVSDLEPRKNQDVFSEFIPMSFFFMTSISVDCCHKFGYLLLLGSIPADYGNT